MTPPPLPAHATPPRTPAPRPADAPDTDLDEWRSGSLASMASSAATLAGPSSLPSETQAGAAPARSFHRRPSAAARSAVPRPPPPRATHSTSDVELADSSSSSTATSDGSQRLQPHLPKPTYAHARDPPPSPRAPRRSITPPTPSHRNGEDGAPHAGRALQVLRRLLLTALNSPPSLFTINMGTGIVSILLHNFPYPARWLEYLGTIVFVLNVVIFVLLLAATIARFAFWHGVWGVLTKHNVSGFFWGAFPMGFVTIVNMICFVCVPAWGKAWAYIALAFWWADVVVSVVVSLGMVFVLFTRQAQTWQTFAPVWLLPIVACVVAAASGAIVSETLMPYNAHLARGTLVVSYVVWGLGVPLAMMVISLLVLRFATGGRPAAAALPSVFLPLGPCGQGAYGIITMGVAARRLAYQHDTAIVPGLSLEQIHFVGDTMWVGGLVTGFILWGLGLAWYLLAFAMFIDGVRKDISLLGINNFTLGLWALTFPIGVFATATTALGQELDSTAFKVIASFISVQVILHWLYVGAVSAWSLIRGELFAAPEIKGLDNGAVVTRHWHRAVADLEAGYGDPDAAVAVDAAAGDEQAERAERGESSVQAGTAVPTEKEATARTKPQ